MFGALHLGLGADYKTMVSDSVMLTVGMTYNYYSVSGATAKTFLDGPGFMNARDYWTGVANGTITNDGNGYYYTPADQTVAAGIVDQINEQEAACPGWVCSTANEISSIYKSMGIRVGISAKF
jgi:hypothetical protein